MTNRKDANEGSTDDTAVSPDLIILDATAEQHLRHDKHWRYVSQHTVSFWVQSFTSDLRKVTKEHSNLRTYGLGLGLDNFRVIALTGYFRKLDVLTLQSAYQRYAVEPLESASHTSFQLTSA